MIGEKRKYQAKVFIESIECFECTVLANNESEAEDKITHLVGLEITKRYIPTGTLDVENLTEVEKLAN